MKRVTGVVVLSAVLALASCYALAGSYLLYEWKAGIVVWPNTGTSIASSFVDRLGQALDDACAFWECESPVRATDVENSELALSLPDADTYAYRMVPPLLWEGALVRPIVVFAFPDPQSMRSMLGVDDCAEAFWVSAAMASVFPSTPWWMDVWGSTTENLLSSHLADREILVHELTHWLTHAWLRKEQIESSRIPNYISEGMATLASEPFCQVSTPYGRLGAISWASHNCLAEDIEGIMRYSVGKSLVGYLVDDLGPRAFLNTLRDWSNPTYVAIDRYQPGWRESLGLPEQCEGE